MRITAKLLSKGLSDKEVVEIIVKDNLFQYPTEKTIKKMASSCIRRLRAMDEFSLVEAIAYHTHTDFFSNIPIALK